LIEKDDALLVIDRDNGIIGEIQNLGQRIW